MRVCAAQTVGDPGKWNVDKSWHAQYKDSAYVYVGGLPYDLSEGDIIVIFSQFGEIVDVNMPRDKDTGKPKGFAFIAYEDQRSTILAVDNFNGAKVLGRMLRCDHCASFNEEQKKAYNVFEGWGGWLATSTEGKCEPKYQNRPCPNEEVIQGSLHFTVRLFL